MRDAVFGIGTHPEVGIGLNIGVGMDTRGMDGTFVKGVWSRMRLSNIYQSVKVTRSKDARQDAGHKSQPPPDATMASMLSLMMRIVSAACFAVGLS